MTDSQKKAIIKYKKNNWKEFKIAMPMSEFLAVKEYCEKNNVSRTGLIRTLLKEKINPCN